MTSCGRELAKVRDMVDQVRDGRARAPATARSAINEMTMRQNDWTLGAYCARTAASSRRITRSRTTRSSHTSVARRRDWPVIDRLEEEHHVIHDVLEEVDAALVGRRRTPRTSAPLEAAIDLLTDTLLSHLAYEEQQLVEPLARLGFYPGQL